MGTETHFFAEHRGPIRKSHYRTSLGTGTDDRQMEFNWTDAQTNLTHEVKEEKKVSPSEVSRANLARRAYPLAYDPNGPHGDALNLLETASKEASRMVESYNDADLATVGSSLAAIAALMSKCYPLTSFNPALGAIVSFIRRATLVHASDQVNLPQLMALSRSLQKLSEMPLISLNDSADLVDELERHQWKGQSKAISDFLAALFGEESSDIKAPSAPIKQLG